MSNTGTGCDIWGNERMSLALVVCDILKRTSNIWFIENGTLLGAYRNGNLIPHDDDFDILSYCQNVFAQT